MDILCLDQFATLGGGQQCFLDLLPAFDERSWRPRMVLPGAGPFSDRLAREGCEVKSFVAPLFSSKKKSILEVVPYCITLKRALDTLEHEVGRKKPNLLYVNGPRYLPAATRAARRHQIPLLFHAHNRVLQRRVVAHIGRLLFKSRASVISCCSFAVEPLRAHLPAGAIRIVYSGTADLRRASLPRAGGVRRIGVVGRIAVEKGHLEFIRAARLVSKSAPDATFLVVGSASGGGLAYYDDVLRESAGLPVTFLGWQDDVAEAMNNLDLLVVPSLAYDSAPRVILEAFSAGVPVLAFASGGIPELIEQNRTGFLVHELTPEALATRTLEVMRMPRESLNLVALEARQAWFKRFRVERYREEICESILHSADPSPMRAIA